MLMDSVKVSWLLLLLLRGKGVDANGFCEGELVVVVVEGEGGRC